MVALRRRRFGRRCQHPGPTRFSRPRCCCCCAVPVHAAASDRSNRNSTHRSRYVNPLRLHSTRHARRSTKRTQSTAVTQRVAMSSAHSWPEGEANKCARSTAIRCTALHCDVLLFAPVASLSPPPPDSTRLCALPLGRTCPGDAFNAELNNLTRASSSKVSANHEADSTQL